jgi:hypothetical protein
MVTRTGNANRTFLMQEIAPLNHSAGAPVVLSLGCRFQPDGGLSIPKPVFANGVYLKCTR